MRPPSIKVSTFIVALAISRAHACLEIRFSGGVGKSRFPAGFRQQRGSLNGRAVWASHEGYALFHVTNPDVSGEARWIIATKLGWSHGFAFLNSWALSPIDATYVSPASTWQIHDGTAWIDDSEAKLVCSEPQEDGSLWLEFTDATHLTGAYVQTGTVWQEDRHVYEQKPFWPDSLSVFLYWARMNSTEVAPRWYLSPSVGETNAVWAVCEGQEKNPIDLLKTARRHCHVFLDGEWRVSAPQIISGAAGGGNWWLELQSHRNSFLNMSTSIRALNNGVRMPWIGLGTDGISGEHIEAAVQNGIRLIDTAMIYQNEEVVSLALQNGPGRHQAFLVSKVWHTQLGFNATLMAFKDHITKLNTTYLDLLLVHWPHCVKELGWMNCEDVENSSVGTWQESWKAFERLYAEGRVRAIGVSNFDYNLLWEASTSQRPAVRPHVIQNWFDPLQTDSAVRDLAEKNQVAYMGYAPLRYTLHGLHATDRTSEIEGLTQRYTQALNLAQNIAQEVMRTPAQVILRWMLHLDVAVIPRSSNSGHVYENMDLLSWSLDPHHVDRLSRLSWSAGLEL